MAYSRSELPDQISASNFVDSIQRHVDKQHVGTTDAKITNQIRRAVAKFKRLHQYDGVQYDATLRDDCVKLALDMHHENQQQYRVVTGAI